MIGIQLGIAGAVAVVIAGLGAYAWDADRALDREQKRGAVLEASVKQLGETLARKDEEIRLRNKTWAAVIALPEARLRVCAQRTGRVPPDGCCLPAPAECKP